MDWSREWTRGEAGRVAEGFFVDPPELVGYGVQVGRAAGHLGAIRQKLPAPLVIQTGGYEGLLEALVPPYNSVVNLFHDALRSGRRKLTNVQGGLNRSASRYAQTDTSNARLMAILRGQLPPPAGEAGQPAPRSSPNTYADVSDPVAAMDQALPLSSTPRRDPAIERFEPVVRGLQSVWREEVGGDLHRSLIEPLLGDFDRVSHNARQWEQVGAALHAVRANVLAGVRTMDPSWRGEAAGYAEELIRDQWGAALNADGVTARQLGSALRPVTEAFQRIRGPVVQRIDEVVSALTEARPRLQIARYRDSGLALVRRAVESHNAAIPLIAELGAAVDDARKLIADIHRTGLALWRLPDLQAGTAPDTAGPAVQAGGEGPGRLGTGGAYRVAKEPGGSLDQIQLTPRDPSVPQVRIPNHTDADGFKVAPAWQVLDPSHHYRVETRTNIPFERGSALIAREIADHPVPNSGALTATPEGTRNDAAVGQYVRSYTVASPDPTRYTDVMVNYTIAGEHGFHEGYVMRYGEKQPDGTVKIISYGEGNALIQHRLNFPLHVLNDQLWAHNQAGIEERVSRELGIEPRPRPNPFPKG